LRIALCNEVIAPMPLERVLSMFAIAVLMIVGCHRQAQ